MVPPHAREPILVEQTGAAADTDRQVGNDLVAGVALHAVGGAVHHLRRSPHLSRAVTSTRRGSYRPSSTVDAEWLKRPLAGKGYAVPRLRRVTCNAPGYTRRRA